MPRLSYRLGDSGDYQVWLQMEPGDPIAQAESMIIGFGDTMLEAKADAIKELSLLMDELTGPLLPAGTVCPGRD
jgi:hypothetical protein